MTVTDPVGSRAARRGFSTERQASMAVPIDPSVARLHLGDPCFPTPEHIVAAATDALASGRYTRYAPSQGDPELRSAIAARVSAIAGTAIEDSDVLVTSGATSAIHCALSALVDPGDEVIVFQPYYSLYRSVIDEVGATVVEIPTGPGFRPRADDLMSALTPRSRLLILNNPVNPTGVVLAADELAEIAEVAERAGLIVLADEVYDELVYDTPFISTLRLPRLVDRLVYVNSFSKTYAMTGWRLGYVVARGEIMTALRTIHSNSQGPVSWISQRAGIAALTGPEGPVREMLDGYAERRRRLLELLPSGCEVIAPEGAFYVFVRLPGSTSAKETTQRLLEVGVAVRSGTEFGSQGEGFVRVSYAASMADIERGAEAIGALVGAAETVDGSLKAP